MYCFVSYEMDDSFATGLVMHVLGLSHIDRIVKGVGDLYIS